ncbi:MAG: SLC13 family permease [Anaerolineales bacterium]|nr:SLC13 family permease [Anaerolineales bacterium]
MTGEIGLVLTILGASVILFASEKVRVDVVSMMVLLALLLTGLLTTEEAFSGFSNPAVITVWAIYIVSASLTHTGIADVLGRYIGKIAGTGEARLIFVLMASVGLMSAFMNNIGATAVLLPVTIGLGRKTGIPASKLLIPLAFGSLLGGITTLIGTPPNLLASDALQEVGLAPFRLFDFTPMGLIILSSSLIYMTLIGRHLLPSYAETLHTDPNELTREYQLKDYLAELNVLPESLLIGKTIVESGLGEIYDLTVMGVVRDGRMRLGILPNAHIRAGDKLLVKGSEQQMLSVRREIGVTLSSESDIDEHDWQNEEVTVAELIISQKAPFIGKTLKSANFRARYGLTVLAIWREEKSIAGQLENVRLRLGDTLLVQGRRERIEEAGKDIAFLLLTTKEEEPTLRTSKAPLNLFIFVSMITLVGLGWLHISVAAVLGATLSVLTGCLTMDEAYKSIEWKSVYLIAGMLPLGIAMENTGAALFLSEKIIGLVGGLGPRGIMVGLFVLTTMLTAFMSNAAAAVLVAPIAIQSSVTLGVEPHAFVMGTAIAASNSFVTPIGHQACVLVYGPGGYRFFDFARVGLPLTILIWILMTIFLPIFFPFYPA